MIFNCKKILIIGQPFNKVSGGGITLSNLFSGWDGDKIAVATTGHGMINADFSICKNYYCLGKNEHKWIFPFNYIQHSYKSGKITDFRIKSDNPSMNLRLTKLSAIRIYCVKKLLFPLLHLLGLSHCISHIKVSKEFLAWYDSFKPDIVYTQLSSLELINFVSELKNIRNFKLVIHIMDDWPTTIVKPGLFSAHWKKIIDASFRKVINDASMFLTISDAMRSEYSRRYNKDSIVFHNPIDIDFWSRHQKSDYYFDNCFTILYSGRIGLGIDSSLKIFAECVEDLVETKRLVIKFKIQSKDKPKWINSIRSVEHLTYVDYSELPKTFSDSDILLLPYDFDRVAQDFIQFSMPTKISEYMISGTPIIIFSPKNTALYKYATTYKCAYLISENNKKIIKKGIEELYYNQDLRKKLGRKAMEIAEKKHSTSFVKKKFVNRLNNI